MSFPRRPAPAGHRRLAVIDPSAAGHQPMASTDGLLWITYNGEVYNFTDLRSELERRGHRFRSRSDTEVILVAYQEYGVACLDRFHGMFAFAIWDARTRTLFLARDRLGKKPLYYLLDRDGIAFASEPKAFFADPRFTAKVDPQAISHYLTYRYVPSPLTAFRGVHKLPAAHSLLVRNESVTTGRYWKLCYAPKRDLTETEARMELLGRLREAVRRRLVADVPLGAFLSGGVDSSTVVALMAACGSRPVKTFSIGFEEEKYSELPWARMVARRYGTDHHEFVVRLQDIELLTTLAWQYSEPFGDASAVPTYHLAQLARQHVTVALNGDGGDENFAGYPRYGKVAWAGRCARVPLPLRRAVAALGGALPAPGRATTLYARGRRFLETLPEPAERKFARWATDFETAMKAELCTPDFLRAAGGTDSIELILNAYQASDAPDLIDASLDVDVNTYLPDDLLVKMDIATMAHGLEARSPFLDHEIMEFCASLPSGLKLRGSITKHLLKEATRDLLPREVIDRPKRGFGPPIAEWFRGDLGDRAADVLLSPRALGRGYFRKEVLQRLLAEHLRGVRGWHQELWNLLMLELWHRAFIDRPPAGPEAHGSVLHASGWGTP